ncbi:leucine-rich repeat-containing protein 14-like [Cinclus cinclus]|uniref:leucine-rich repeat-containing protein 14-like n=1 Tax=Cinclus cinclus TaxID=127875 RepID=UPI002E0D4FBF
MTGISDSVPPDTPGGLITSFITDVLVKACMEMSKKQRKFQRREFKRHKGISGVATATVLPPGVDIHTDLCIYRECNKIHRDGLQAGASGLLRLKCREFEAKHIPASKIVPLLESLDPSCVRRVDLNSTFSELKELLQILPHLLCFPQLRSLKLQFSFMYLRNPTPELAKRIHCVSRLLGMLLSLRELNLGWSTISGNLHQMLCFPFLRYILGFRASQEFSPGFCLSSGQSGEKLPVTHKMSHNSSPQESMDSLAFLCARRIVAHHPLPAVPAHLHPILFQAAFLDGRTLVLRDLVATWPFKELHLQRLVGHMDLLQDHSCKDCVQAVIQGVVEKVKRELEEPACHSRLRILDMTDDVDSVLVFAGWTASFSTVALVNACVEVFKDHQEFQRHGFKQHKSCSGAASAAPQPPAVDIHADLRIDTESYRTLRDGLQAAAAGPLRLKCRELKAEFIPAASMVPLLRSLDPSRLRRVDLCFSSLGLTELSEILRHLSRFLQLRSLKLWNTEIDLQHPTPESAFGICCVSWQLGMLPSLRELSLGMSKLSGNLHQILCHLQAPLESLRLAYCSLLPASLTFLSQSFHAPALKILDLSGHDVSQGLLEPLRLLLEKTSASLLHLTLECCHIADPHLKVLIPTLQRCSRLRFLGLYYNPLSMAALRDLLQKTLELPDLCQVVYPEPIDCYREDPVEFYYDFMECADQELLAAAAAEISQLLENSGRTDIVWTDDPDEHCPMDYFSL